MGGMGSNIGASGFSSPGDQYMSPYDKWIPHTQDPNDANIWRGGYWEQTIPPGGQFQGLQGVRGGLMGVGPSQPVNTPPMGSYNPVAPEYPNPPLPVDNYPAVGPTYPGVEWGTGDNPALGVRVRGSYPPNNPAVGPTYPNMGPSFNDMNPVMDNGQLPNQQDPTKPAFPPPSVIGRISGPFSPNRSGYGTTPQSRFNPTPSISGPFGNSPYGSLTQLSQMGRSGDTELAHVNPYEKQVLKRMGGSGGRNPYTGLREFAFSGGSHRPLAQRLAEADQPIQLNQQVLSNTPNTRHLVFRNEEDGGSYWVEDPPSSQPTTGRLGSAASAIGASQAASAFDTSTATNPQQNLTGSTGPLYGKALWDKMLEGVSTTNEMGDRTQGFMSTVEGLPTFSKYDPDNLKVLLTEGNPFAMEDPATGGMNVHTKNPDGTWAIRYIEPDLGGNSNFFAKIFREGGKALNDIAPVAIMAGAALITGYAAAAAAPFVTGSLAAGGGAAAAGEGVVAAELAGGATGAGLLTEELGVGLAGGTVGGAGLAGGATGMTLAELTAAEMGTTMGTGGEIVTTGVGGLGLEGAGGVGLVEGLTQAGLTMEEIAAAEEAARLAWEETARQTALNQLINEQALLPPETQPPPVEELPPVEEPPYLEEPPMDIVEPPPVVQPPPIDLTSLPVSELLKMGLTAAQIAALLGGSYLSGQAEADASRENTNNLIAAARDATLQQQEFWKQNAFPRQDVIEAARKNQLAQMNQMTGTAQKNFLDQTSARGIRGGGILSSGLSGIERERQRQYGTMQNDLTKFANTPLFAPNMAPYQVPSSTTSGESSLYNAIAQIGGLGTGSSLYKYLYGNG